MKKIFIFIFVLALSSAMFGQVFFQSQFNQALNVQGWYIAPSPNPNAHPSWNNWTGQPTLTGPSGTTGRIRSSSWDNVNFDPLVPENWIATPQINIPEGTGTTRLRFWTIGNGDGQEHFSVYLTTAASPTIEQPAMTSGVNPFIDEDTGHLLFEGNTPQGNQSWVERTVTIPPTIHGNVYIAFRHRAPSFDGFVLDIGLVTVDRVQPWAVSMNNLVLPSHFPVGHTGYTTTSYTVQNRGLNAYNRNELRINFYAMDLDGEYLGGNSGVFTEPFHVLTPTTSNMGVNSAASTHSVHTAATASAIETAFNIRLGIIDTALGAAGPLADGIYKIRAEAVFFDSALNPATSFPPNYFDRNIRLARSEDVRYVGYNPTGTHSNNTLIPFTYQGNNISQFLYRKSELQVPINDAGFAKIYGLAFSFTNATIVTPEDEEFNHLWIANVPAGHPVFDSITDWYSPTNMTKVAAGFTKVGFTQLGSGEAYVEFDTPFDYTGGDLIIMTQRSSGINYTTAISFRAGGSVANTVLSAAWTGPGGPIVNDTVVVPAGINPSRSAARPVFRFLFEQRAASTVTGVVACEDDGSFIEDASVSIVGSTRAPVFTDADGEFTLNHVEHDSSLKFAAFGYYPKTYPLDTSYFEDGDLITPLEINLDPLPTPVNVVVTVTANDLAPTLHLSGVHITLLNPEGFFLEEATSGGTPVVYTVAGVFPHQSYTLTATRAGYDDYTQTVVIPEHQATDFPVTFEMIETTRPPLGVFAVANDDDTIARISWYNPYVDETAFSHNVGASGPAVGASPTPFFFAHRYTPDMLTDNGVTGQSLYKVSFVPSEINAKYMLQLYTPVSTPLTNPVLPEIPDYSQMFDTSVLTISNLGTYHDMYLMEPFPIPTGRELWIVFYVFDYTGFPAGREQGVQATGTRGYGDMTKIGTSPWDILDNYMGTTVFPHNWAITGYTINYSASADAMSSLRRLSITNAAMENFYPADNRDNNVQLTGVANDNIIPAMPRPARTRNGNRAMYEGYRVYRMPLDNIELSLTTLIDSAVDGVMSAAPYVSTVDSDWGDMVAGTEYLFAVTTIYVPADTTGLGGHTSVLGASRESEPTFTNILIPGAEGITITVNVSLNEVVPTGNQGITVNLTRVANSLPVPVIKTFVAGQTSAVFDAVRLGAIYKLHVSKDGFESYENTFLWNMDSTVNVVLHKVEVFFSESFETPTFAPFETWTRWSNTKHNNTPDAYVWKPGLPGTRMAGRNNSHSAFSESYCFEEGQCVEPENWLITPPIAIPADIDPIMSQIMLSFSYAPGSPTRPQDKLFVYILSTDNPEVEVADFVTGINTSNLDTTAGETVSPDAHLIEIVGTEATWSLVATNISSFIDVEQNLFIAFRHSKSHDRMAMRLDDISVYSRPIVPVSVSGLVREDIEEGAVVANANIKISSIAQGFDDVNIAPTSATGAFNSGVILHPDTEYTFTVSKDGYFPTANTVTVEETNIIGQILTIKRHGTINGVVKDAAGTNLSGVRVTLMNGTTQVGEYITTTSNGQFSWTALEREAGYSLVLFRTAEEGTPTTMIIENINLTTQHTHAAGDVTFVPTLNDVEVVIPAITALTGNYPNPFNPETTISFDMSTEALVTIEIFNVRGQKVTTLVNDVRAAGIHNVVWKGDDSNGRSVGSGIYFYRMTTDNYTATQKMILMK
jgi:hypothetical protein